VPELPDIEAFRRNLAHKALRKPVRSTSVHDERILDNLTPSGLGRRLKSKSFVKACRHGKVLFLRQSRGGGSLVLRFGMTGSVQVCPKGCDTPQYARAELRLSDGSRLAIISQRLLGHIAFTDDEQKFVEQADLGPDALNGDIAKSEFIKIFSESHATAKATLMDQSRIAGIGNVYADEILFQAGVRPDRKADDLSKETAIYA